MNKEKISEYHDIIKRSVESLSYSLVEENASRTKKGITVRVILYSDNGIGLNDCEAVHRLLMPQLELRAPENVDMYLEVSSPGLNRTLKSSNEFSVFTGKAVSILKKDDTNWIHGKISDANDSSVTIQLENGNLTIGFEDIHKAKLDYTR